MKIQLLLLTFLLVVSLPLYGQNRCATGEPTAPQKRILYDQIFQSAQQSGVSRNGGTTCVPIRLYIFREEDGSGGLSDLAMTRGLSFLNSIYQAAGIEFYYASRAYFNDSDAYHYDQQAPDNDTENDLTSTAGESSDAINMYVVNEITTASGFQAAGYAYLPYGDFNLYNRIVMTDVFFSQQPHGTLSHELGHYFGLLHTHSGTENGNMDPDAEAVPRVGPQADCNIDGDMICDTEADPAPNANNMSGCAYTGNDGMGGMETDEYLNLYSPPLNNIMSYYSGFCQDQLFTPGQYAVIQQGLATRQGFNSNTLDAPGMNVAVPLNVSATLNTLETGIEITWQDMANNEFGYVIERASSAAGGGYVPVTYGAVAADETLYTDTDIMENTTYTYRVKPANGDCNAYSNTASYSVGELYCIPSITLCDEYMERVIIGSIDNNSSAAGCTDQEGFTRYLQSTDMEQAGSYPLEVRTNTTYNGDELGVWIDWNQNGDLTDAGEFYAFGGPTAANTFTGNIIVPANASLGSTRMRIRLSYVPEDALAPCNNQLYGEIEDYTVNVLLDPLPVEWRYIRASAQYEGILVEWATEVERDNDFFVLERRSTSADWQELGRMEGRNGTGEEYVFLDESPTTGNNYYRIRQVDYFGEYSYSEIATASWDDQHEIQCYPNPAKDQLYISALTDEVSHIQLWNTTGQLVVQVQANSEESTWEIDLTDLPAAVYYLKLLDQDGVLMSQQQVVIMR